MDITRQVTAGNIGANMDLHPYYCGSEVCRPGHAWGPSVRDHYLIHYVSQGRGIFEADGVSHELGSGDIFLIRPEVISYHRADFSDPWTYTWMGFHGLRAEHYLRRANLTAANPLFRCGADTAPADCLQRMIGLDRTAEGWELKLTGFLYMFMSALIEMRGRGGRMETAETAAERYVSMAMDFIGMNYSRKISVAETARYVGIDRKHLYAAFIKTMHLSPQEFLIGFRLSKACELLSNPQLSIGAVARAVGYDDQLLFPRVFRKKKGVSPREFRNRNMDIA